MNFQDAVKTCITQKYATISGRAARSEFWWFMLALLIVSIITGVIDGALFTTIDPTTGKPSGISPVNTIFSLLTLVPNICVGARRLHDINKSGWWQLLWLIPILGWILLIVWFCTKGTAGENRFGAAPLTAQMIG
jgi:uncharacterized membrane protein YhaH (DUF805 family)